MTDYVMPSSYDHFSTKRPSADTFDPRPVKRSRLDFLLCDAEAIAQHAAALHAPPDDATQRSNVDPRPRASYPANSAPDDAPTDLDVPISPQDPTHEPHSAHSASTEPRTPPVPQVDKFTKSRAVGQSHRDNEKEHVESLRRDVEDCRTENILLFALFACSYKNEHSKPVPSNLLDPIRGQLPYDRPEDYGVHTDDLASTMGLYKLSGESARLLGQRYISPALACVLLELIIYRRNLVPDTSDLNELGTRRRRRRSTYRVGTSRAVACETMQYAIDLFLREDMGDEDPATYVDRRMGSLACLMTNWHHMEGSRNPPQVVDDDARDNHYPPSSPTRPAAAEFGSPNRRRGEGAKRCSRCNMVKRTGSGHGRSKCDDGYSISSLVPYPASPRSE